MIGDLSVSLDPPAATKPWIERLARLGYAVKGTVYILLGWLTARAALGTRDTPSGSREAFGVVLAQPFGRVLLMLIGIGLAGYALWRLVAAICDAERKGNDLKGYAVRGYYLVNGLVHGVLAWLALAAARSGQLQEGGGDGDAPRRTAWLMAQPFGRWLVIGVGIGVLVAAGRQVQLAFGGYRKKVPPARLPANARRWMGPVAALGLLSRATVLAIVGGFLVLAGWHQNPDEARGLGAALHTLEVGPLGTEMLTVVAVGLAAYGVFQLIEARYRPIRP